MSSQGTRPDEGKCALNGRLCARDIGDFELWHEESQFSGCHFTGVAGMDSIHPGIRTIRGTNAAELECINTISDMPNYKMKKKYFFKTHS